MDLAQQLLERRLYKLAGVSDRASYTLAPTIWESCQDREARVRLEADVARLAEVAPDAVLMWIPKPGMRLKAAEVLVENEHDQILKLHDYDSSGPNRSKEIYESHERLWRVSVFVRSDVDERHRERLLAYLSPKLGKINWASRNREDHSILRLVVQEVASDPEHRLTPDQQRELVTLLSQEPAFHIRGNADRGSDVVEESFGRLVNRAKRIAAFHFGQTRQVAETEIDRTPNSQEATDDTGHTTEDRRKTLNGDSDGPPQGELFEKQT